MRRHRALIYWTAGAGLLLGLLTGRAQGADTAGPRPIPTPDLLQIRKEVAVRLVDGTPAAGITIRLAPAGPQAGGPPGGAPVQTAPTDARGTATFQGLGGWIWLVTFQGTFQGRALVPVTAQGQAPYGTARTGGGFPTLVEGQEEDEAPTPELVAGTPQPERQPATFVLLASGAYWIPALDLAGPSDLPQALGAPTDAPASVPTPLADTPASATDSAAEQMGAVGPWIFGLGLLLAGGVALYQVRERRRRERRTEGDRR